MKRKIAVILLAAMVLMLAACHQEPKGTAWGVVSKDDETIGLTIDFDNRIIRASDKMATVVAYDSYGNVIGNTQTEEEGVYHYTYEDGDITITYPNGATYWESVSANGAIAGWDGDYDTDRYIDGMTLAMQLTQAYNNSGKNWDEVVIMGLVCLVVIGLCLVDVIHPEWFFELRYSLWVRDAEPTEFALMMSRMGGVIGIVLCVIMFLIVLFR